MKIPHTHRSISVLGVDYDLAHLNAFAEAIPGKGVQKGSDLGVVVVFSCHVFTERANHGELHHIVDHHGTRRTFDQKRYEMSKELPDRIRAKIKSDELTYVSKSFGGIENLILLEDREGLTWTIVYCLCGIQEHTAVRMEILSAHPDLPLFSGPLLNRACSPFVCHHSAA
ncbi:hypothetical protein [Hoeflea sp.]|uniref:hypothetical protein n=1 Tax=Hoeflea sp. TaxID=1940281 RepID=UPI0025C3C66B|nr:hypothetical protein [Hoeflea sp.]